MNAAHIQELHSLLEILHRDAPDAKAWAVALTVLVEIAKQSDRIERSLEELRDTLMLPEPRGLHFELDSQPAILRKQAQ